MIEITLHDETTIRVGPTISRHGAALKEIRGARYNGDQTWRIPLNALGSVVAALGPKVVSIDYDVLFARDEQLRDVVAGYKSLGCRIWNANGKLATDNDTLTAALQPIAALLLGWLPTEPGPKKAPGVVPRAVVEASDDPELQLWLWGQREVAQ